MATWSVCDGGGREDARRGGLETNGRTADASTISAAPSKPWRNVYVAAVWSDDGPYGGAEGRM
jgi:hypothetical protein